MNKTLRNVLIVIAVLVGIAALIWGIMWWMNRPKTAAPPANGGDVAPPPARETTPAPTTGVESYLFKEAGLFYLQKRAGTTIISTEEISMDKFISLYPGGFPAFCQRYPSDCTNV